MEKKELLEFLEKSKHWEDDFIIKYDDNAVWELLKTLPKEKFEKIEPLLKENISDSERHHKMISDLINDIESGKYDL